MPALEQFSGTIAQVPPAYAAVHVQGTRAYVRARRGEAVTLTPRHVTIFGLELLELRLPRLSLEVECSTGTYVRALARDLGEALGCGAHLEALTRTQVGSFALEDAVPLHALADRAADQGWDTVMLPLDWPLRHWPACHLSAEEATQVMNGMRVAVSGAVARDNSRAPTIRKDACLRCCRQWIPLRRSGSRSKSFAIIHEEARRNCLPRQGVGKRKDRQTQWRFFAETRRLLSLIVPLCSPSANSTAYTGGTGTYWKPLPRGRAPMTGNPPSSSSGRRHRKCCSRARRYPASLRWPNES